VILIGVRDQDAGQLTAFLNQIEIDEAVGHL
jgi:hypothetical protein